MNTERNFLLEPINGKNEKNGKSKGTFISVEKLPKEKMNFSIFLMSEWHRRNQMLCKTQSANEKDENKQFLNNLFNMLKRRNSKASVPIFTPLFIGYSNRNLFSTVFSSGWNRSII